MGKELLISKIIKSESEYAKYKKTILAIHSVSNSAGDSLLGTLKSSLKKFDKFYNLLLLLFGVLPSSKYFKFKKKFLNPGDEEIVVNLGAGPSGSRNPRVLNADIFPFEHVDIICDAHNLPFKDNSVDKIVALGMLEHVTNPVRVLEEIHRSLKPNGQVLCCLPFLQPFHAAPNDYSRWTHFGVRQIFSEFSSIEVSVGVGATSSLLWIFQEWIATFLSFGSKNLKDIIFMILMFFLFPLKILDLLFICIPGNESIASAFLVIAKK